MSVPTTTAPAPVPGAPAPASTKPKRSKKKNAASSSKLANGDSELVTAVPSTLPADAAELSSTEVVPAVQPETNTALSKGKGPVEEVIAKRMRQLSKKLQRFRGYAAQPHDSLNADQRSGVASLPMLEGVYKELEDLTKQVEYVELEQAGKVREIREQAREATKAAAAAQVGEFQSALGHPLSLFLRLHALLHPARSDDHEHLTFTRLDLPANLMEEVQATDVLRVGRMHEDLLAGGDAASGVIAGLVAGATGEDEENDHVHALLKLLAESDVTSEEVVAPQTDEAAPDADQAEIVEPASLAASVSEPPEGQDEYENSVAPSGSAAGTIGGALNFLQEDELADSVGPAVTLEDPAPVQHAPVESAPTSVSIIAGNNPSALTNLEPEPHFDWAADEDMDEAAEAAQIRQAFDMPPSGAETPAAAPLPSGSAEAAVKPIGADEASPIEQDNVLANAHATPAPTVNGQAGETAPAATAASGQQKRQGGRGKGKNAGRGSGPRPSQSQHQRQEQRGAAQKSSADDDGFQVVGRQAPAAGAQRGRGGAGGRGEAGRGRGGQRGRGGAGARGGATGVSGERSATNANPRPAKQPRQPSQQSAAAPAASQ
ncbi:hypothetical protein IAU60_001120 [Kwoniella sp. DSM 27419]